MQRRRMPGGTWLSSSLCLALALFAGGCNTHSVAPTGGIEASSRSATSTSEARSAAQAPRTAPPAEKQEPAHKISQGVVAQVAPPVEAEKPKAPARPRPKKPAVMPRVLMSKQHRDSCKVFVGDVLPDAELPELAGKKRKLSTEYGKKLTLVCYFGGQLPAEEQLLADLTPDVVDQFDKDQVRVIGVAVGRPADAVAALVKKKDLKFPVFVDADRKAYDALGKLYLPRSYLIDSAGKILWLDLEYSATTRRQINEAIRSVLEKK